MNEREILIAKITEDVTKKAKSQKLNEVQTQLLIEEEIKKALEEYDKKIQSENTVIPMQTTITERKEKEEGKTIKNTKDVKDEIKEKKYIVNTPVVNFCGEVAGVQFAYGKAQVKEGWVLNWFKEHGYNVEEVSN